MQTVRAVLLGNAEEVLKQRDDLLAQVSAFRSEVAEMARVKARGHALEVFCVALYGLVLM